MSAGATAIQKYEQRIERLRLDLTAQGRRVQRLLENAVEAIFDRDAAKAARVSSDDAEIDRVDVEIERACVELLVEIAHESVALEQSHLRWILTVVKVNNELERIADEACDIAHRVPMFIALRESPPERFRVMANSVIGILDGAVQCLERVDTRLARTVLMSDDAVDAFEQAIIREVQQGVADRTVSVDFAFAVSSIATMLDRVDDHCTNIAEQVIYVATGNIVRHQGGQWSEPAPPE